MLLPASTWPAVHVNEERLIAVQKLQGFLTLLDTYEPLTIPQFSTLARDSTTKYGRLTNDNEVDLSLACLLSLPVLSNDINLLHMGGWVGGVGRVWSRQSITWAVCHSPSLCVYIHLSTLPHMCNILDTNIRSLYSSVIILL